jgi:DNA-binding protein HU-beta
MERVMNKVEFVKHIAEQHKCTQIEAEKNIDMFTSSVIDAIGQGNEISLIGFGNFSVSKVAARSGRNPRTGEALEIAAYNQPKFKVGQKLKDAVNPK